MPEFQTVCKASDIPVGEARMFVVSGTMIGVFNIRGDFHAIQDECPHAGASLSHGLIEANTVTCRIHHWRFCIRDGQYLDEDKPQLNAQRFQVRVVGDYVQVRVTPASENA